MPREPLIIRSPKQSIVTKLFVESGKVVEAGCSIFSVDNLDEERWLTHVSSQLLVAQGKRAAIAPSEIAERLATLDEILDSRRVVVRAREVALDGIEKQVTVGTLTFLDLLRAQRVLTRAKTDLRRVEVERAEVENNSAAALKHLDAMIALFEKEIEFVRKRMERLTFKAPAPGRIELDVAVGSPVARAQVVGRIYAGGGAS